MFRCSQSNRLVAPSSRPSRCVASVDERQPHTGAAAPRPPFAIVSLLTLALLTFVAAACGPTSGSSYGPEASMTLRYSSLEAEQAPFDAAAAQFYLSGEYALQHGDLSRAAESFVLAAQIQPDIALFHLRAASAFRQLGDYHRASVALTMAERAGASRHELAIEAARNAIAQGARDEAIHALRANFDGAPESYFVTWRRFEDPASNDDALRAAEAWVTTHPESAEAWGAFAEEMEERGDLEAAIGAWQQAALLPGGEGGSLVDAATAALELGDPERAATLSATCTERFRETIRCYLLRVQALSLVLGEANPDDAAPPDGNEQARAELHAAIRELARMTTASASLLRSTLQDLDTNAAASVALAYEEQALALRPYNPSMRIAAGWWHAERGDEALALTRFEEALELRPDNVDALNFVGYTLAERGEDLERAESLLRSALAIVPGSASVLDSLAWAIYHQGRYQEALELQQRAVELAPNQAVLLDHLGDIYRALGRDHEAREVWTRALQFATERDEDVLETVPEKLNGLPAMR